MVPARTSLNRLGLWLTAPPDEVLADAAREGELIVARVRTWLTLLLTLIPLLSLAVEPDKQQHYIGLAVALTAVFAAIVIERRVTTNPYRQNMAFVSSITDVSIVSLGLLSFWLISQPIVTTNSRVLFDAYFLALGASALRYDPRVTIAAGTVAITQYSLLVLLTWVTHHDGLLTGNAEYGTFSWSGQMARVILLLAMIVVALAIVNRTQRLRRMSTGDRLTGLFNRAYAEEYLATELLRTQRSKSTFVVAMLDVDHFKRFNDTYGHAAGDRALQSVAEILRSGVRRTDIVARYGGEEILLIFPGADIGSGLEKLDEIRVRIGLHDITLPRGGTARITVSIGVAAWPEDGISAAALLDIADARLYDAKRAGRNRVIGPNAGAVADVVYG
jgi:two-component system cell cycle response regulator